MLSERIAALASRMENYREDGMTMEPLAVVMMASALRDMADDAAILEQNTRPIASMGGTAPFDIPEAANVVRLG